MYNKKWKNLFILQGTRAFFHYYKEKRKESGMYQSAVAEKFKITQGAYTKMEKGDIRIDLVQLETICGIFGKSLSEFVIEFEKTYGT